MIRGFTLCMFLAFFTIGLQAQESRKPNIILIVTDDQRADTVKYMPKLQKLLVDRGTHFTNAVVTTPLCCPSRATILTGQYAHNHNVKGNGKKNYANFNDNITVATLLKENRYNTALIGKYLNGYEAPYVPPGWSLFKVFDDSSEETGKYYDYNMVDYTEGSYPSIKSYGDAPEDYSTDVVTKLAIDFIEKSEGNPNPFFLLFAPRTPHEPFTPAPRHDSLAFELKPHRPPSFNEDDIKDKNSWLQRKQPFSVSEINELDLVQIKTVQMLQSLDESIEGIFSTLEKIGKLKETIIIFLGGDNGLHWGEHRLTKKRSPYEESIRTALFIFDGRSDMRKSSFDQVVANIDLAPTILEYAGIRRPEYIDGLSLISRLQFGDPFINRDYILIHQPGKTGKNFAVFKGVRSSSKVYIEIETQSGLELELYDLKTDPFQLENIASDPSRVNEVSKFKQILYLLADCKSVSCNLTERQ